MKQLLLIQEVLNDNSLGKKFKFRSHNVRCGRRFAYMNSVTQVFAECLSSFYDRVSLFPTFFLPVCRYLRKKKPKVMRKKGFLKEHACAKSRPRKGINMSTVKSLQQNLCPNNAI